MRRLILIGCSLVVVSVLTVRSARADAANASSTPRVSFAGFWTANLATVASTPKPVATDSKQWNGGGASVDVPLGGRFSFDARAMWNRKGAKLTLASNTLFQDVHADYLSMPLLFKVSGGGSVHAYAVAGPELGIRLRSRVITTLGSARVDEDARDVTRRADVAADAGAGIERDLGRSRLFVEGLYSFGLRNVLKSDTPGEAMRTRTLTLLAGLRF
jgi:outer membrane protein with beta-barrel domain